MRILNWVGITFLILSIFIISTMYVYGSVTSAKFGEMTFWWVISTLILIRYNWKYLKEKSKKLMKL